MRVISSEAKAVYKQRPQTVKRTVVSLLDLIMTDANGDVMVDANGNVMYGV